ncbi:DUF6065 family protein [Hyphobacterium sp.]|uniref:DUF6065 family protein n=1 Tax=Hyphobacterium sp. TaxID=2004662 RepID=UPI003BAA3A82
MKLTIYPLTKSCLSFRSAAIFFDQAEPVFDDPASNPQTENDFLAWRESRADFVQRLAALEKTAVKEKWQKTYYCGLRPDGSDGGKD